MLKISDFARLAQVTVRALRYYDRLGLLKPVHVDDATGYRYYAAAPGGTDPQPRGMRVNSWRPILVTLHGR